ncbi:hypothetical protein DRP53_01635 [candidate division WOR-3 bacterium]|uniref:HAD family hydrolase n=1 Tax=candidate division WOR-3 bacterium TaxID=2052148 RepID=A0A660SKX2_UNCW3|nr:MAG: hypothetical protein DRP53_01635 [candidate division WOR-3 bacterium]
MIRACLFDFWITLVEIDQLDIPTRKERFRDFLKVAKDIFDHCYDETATIADRLRERFAKEVTSRDFIQLLLKRLEIGDDPVDDLDRIYREAVLDLDLRLREGAKEVLNYLRSKYRIGLISNTSVGKVVRQLLKRFDIERYFDSIVLSDEIGIRKPEPYIFHYALRRLDTPPEQAVFIGDSPYLDVLGARRCGIYAIYLSRGEEYPPHLPRPDLIIDGLASLLDRL